MRVDLVTRPKPLMKVPEVAALFDVDPETVRVWVREGKLAARRTPGGRGLRFRRVDVEALLIDPINENGPALAIAAPDEP
ncbi:helix-turn-helix domain-containing protein [Streptosporangium sp. DT93]|uniref:helix-turn-helix domain-containing protein n=1 Tax=Streptosporangium sp. DT93 TaxID=3393428 RepID=UPI003CF09328